MENYWHPEGSENENGSGICNTSGNQITFDVQIGTPPDSPKQPPRNESRELPDRTSPKKMRGCFSWRKRKHLQSLNSGLSPRCPSRDGNEQSEGEILQSSNLRSFSSSDLDTSIRLNNVVGCGGFGSFYKGWINENTYQAAKPGTGMAIAIKRLYRQQGLQGHTEWLAEVKYLGQLCHPNLVKMIGYCAEVEHRCLVYELMPRGNLADHLYMRRSGFQPLSWNVRMNIALGAAKGLAFLHRAETQVIYRDFKTSNILLDSGYNAKLSGFVLAKDGPNDDKSHVSTRFMGTLGYAAPEYLDTGYLTAKSDVYSFGVVFLEMLSGRNAVDRNQPAGERNLIEWAKPYLSSEHSVLRIMDTRLGDQYTQAEAVKATNLVLQCLDMNMKCRPTMEEVVTSLEGLQDVLLPNPLYAQLSVEQKY